MSSMVNTVETSVASLYSSGAAVYFQRSVRVGCNRVLRSGELEHPPIEMSTYACAWKSPVLGDLKVGERARRG